MAYKTRYAIALILSAILFSCSTSGPVDTVQSDSKQEVVSTPAGFSPAADYLTKAEKELLRLDDSLVVPRANYLDAKIRQLLSWQQAYDTAWDEQNSIEDEIESTGELVLEPGASYSFDLESFCVHGGQVRPVTGDGLRLAPIKGDAKNWLPKILKSQGQKRLPQEQVQYLVWSLLSNVTFDELDEKHQATLLQFYPDAQVRFGNRMVSDLTESTFNLMPPEVFKTIDDLKSLRHEILSKKDDFESLVESMAPRSKRLRPIPVGWLKMEQGYLVHATSDNYTRVHFKIYVPEDAGRKPNAIKNLVFRPWEWVALPENGQRLGISSRVVRAPKEKIKNNLCEKLKKWLPKNCRAISDEDRKLILAVANPVNFPKTRYRSPPKIVGRIEEETDCSYFVHEIYGRAKFDYFYSSASNMSCLSTFKEIREAEARPGDLVLYPGHIGILDEQGMVISATMGGRELRSMRDPDEPGFIQSITRLKREQAGRGKSKIIRWSCP